MFTNKIITITTLFTFLPACVDDGFPGGQGPDVEHGEGFGGSSGDTDSPGDDGGGSSGPDSGETDGGTGGSDGASGGSDGESGGGTDGGDPSPGASFDPTPGAIDAWTDGELGYALIPAGPDLGDLGVVEHLVIAPLDGSNTVSLYALDADGEVVRAAELADKPAVDGVQPDISGTIIWGGTNCTVPPCPWEENTAIVADVVTFGDLATMSGTAFGQGFAFNVDLLSGETSIDGDLDEAARAELQVMADVLEDVTPAFPLLGNVPEMQGVDWCKVGKYGATGVLTTAAGYCCLSYGPVACVTCGGLKAWLQDYVDQFCKGK